MQSSRKRKKRADAAPAMRLVKGLAPAGTVSRNALLVDGICWKFRRVPHPLFDPSDGRETMFWTDYKANEFVIDEECFDAAMFAYASCVLSTACHTQMIVVDDPIAPDRFAGFPRVAG